MIKLVMSFLRNAQSAGKRCSEIGHGMGLLVSDGDGSATPTGSISWNAE